MAASRAPAGPYGRAPKGDGGLNSRACLRILLVEHLKVLFNLLICPSNKSKNGRAPKGP